MIGMFGKMALITALSLIYCAAALAQSTVYPKVTAMDEPYGIVEITDFSVGSIPIYNSVDGEPVDCILFEMWDYDNGRFYATRAQNGLKFYPYQLWQGEDAANEARHCSVPETERYLLQLEVVGYTGGSWLKIVSHGAMGCPTNIDGVPMYIPYGVRAGDGKVPGALDFGEYFLIEYRPDYMRLVTWEELLRSANTISNYGGLEVYDAPDGDHIDAAGFGDTMQIVSGPEGDWIQVESYDGKRGWLKWRDGTGLHPQIHALGPSRYDQFDACINVDVN